ncbi:very long-chain acyl-CoA synthetase-like [Haliotis rufescens]|uniref:very long-chain acyl-CoA synthetase-like n=1 Tax=Haliotis rufescens TaxID=6454 RepID=UPI00201EFDC3|nr:very long-chain acyl-CoA synthetase-like [Haliotis rufescens]
MILIVVGTVLATVIAVVAVVMITCPWVKYDVQYIKKGIKLITMLKKKLRSREYAVDSLERQVRERPKQTFIIYQDNNYTYEFVDQKANQIARAALKVGLKAKDVAAIMMLNEPAFLWTYFGLQKIGVSVSLINYHLRHKSLAHSITNCKPKLLIVGQGDELSSALKEIQDDLGDIRILTHDADVPGLKFESLGKLTESESKDTVDYKHRAEVTVTDVASFIFTSGTTGLPKPAIVSHKKTLFALTAFSVFDFNENDVLYEVLPLYHSAGLNLGVLSVLNAGAVMVLRTKFSASNFWYDCRKHNVTVVHYIGEMCRYLVNRPKTQEDGIHTIRTAVGNGLRKDIWEEFATRFRIPQVLEFYAATESPVGFTNIFNKVGSVGRASPLTSLLFPAVFVEFDEATQTARRDAGGRCIRVGKDRVGLLISPLDKIRTFEGYHNRPVDNEKKLLRDVFKSGDVYFNTGDLFYVDNEYFVYFQDRTGDTYRWKGENVSTNEVSNVLSTVDFVHDANVYGVTVPGCEGRAGMAAIHLKEDVQLDSKGLKDISRHCAQELPSYARPKFLRVQRQMSLTSTFKQQKVDLINEAFNPTKVDEPLYYFDSKKNAFEPISEDIYEDIANGRVAL